METPVIKSSSTHALPSSCYIEQVLIKDVGGCFVVMILPWSGLLCKTVMLFPCLTKGKGHIAMYTISSWKRLHFQHQYYNF